MNTTKILWLQILLVCTTVLGFVWAATQWTAWQLAFQPQLGPPWFGVFGRPVRQPPASSDGGSGGSPTTDMRTTSSSPGLHRGFGRHCPFAVAVAMSMWRATEVKKLTIYGSARWEPTREPTSAIRVWGMCCASRRPEAARDVGLVAPALLTWPGSAIVHDIKGENWSLTAGWRARFGQNSCSAVSAGLILS